MVENAEVLQKLRGGPRAANVGFANNIRRGTLGVNASAKSVDPSKVATRMAQLKRDKELAPQVVQTAPEVKAIAPVVAEQVPPALVNTTTPETEAPVGRGVFYGLKPDGSAFMQIVGKISDTDFLALVKYAELQNNVTLGIYSPVSNNKIVQLLEEIKGAAAK